MQLEKRQTISVIVRLFIILFAVAGLVSIPLVSPLSVAGQCGSWSCNGTTKMYYAGGNVGIGTSNPDRLLVVEGAEALGKFRRYNATTPSHAPTFLFERARGTSGSPANIAAGDFLGKVQYRGWVSGNPVEYGALSFIATDLNQNGRFSFVDRDLVTERMVVLNTGNVGIGTTNPQSKLAVNGTITATGIVVTNSGWSDFVFAPDYQLQSLEAIDHHIKTHGTLPGIPSQKEVMKRGVDVGQMQAKLLEKVEELTLYAIQLRKENKRLEDENHGFEQRLQALEEKLR